MPYWRARLILTIPVSRKIAFRDEARAMNDKAVAISEDGAVGFEDSLQLLKWNLDVKKEKKEI